MTEDNSKEIRSKVTEEGFIEISIVKVSVPIPKEDEVLIKIEEEKETATCELSGAESFLKSI